MKQIQLSNIADIVSGYAIPSADMVEEGTPIIKITNIKEDGSLDLVNTAKYNKPITPKLQKFILKDKDVVVCMTGATIGKVARVLKTDQKYIVNQRVCIIRAKDSRLQDFVYHTLTLPTFRKYVEVVGYGAAQPNISAASIGKYRIQSSNELPTQQRIASILSTYDTLIENNTKRIRLLEQMAENLYKEWFVRFRFPGHENVEMENGLPKGWKVERLDAIARVIMGQSPESKFYNEEGKGLPFHQGVGSYGDFYLRDSIYSTEGKRIAEPFSIIFSVRAPVGRININLNRVILGRGVAGINERNGNNAFLLWCLKDKFAKEDSIGNGSIFTSVTKDELLKQKITVPSDDTLSMFNSIAKGFEEEIRTLTQKNTLLTHQRDLLLPRLMSGKLEVMVR